jgi:hypothetical protein
MVVGVPAMNQRLVLRDDQGKDVCTLSDNNAMLGAYPAEDHMGLHVRPPFPFQSSSSHPRPLPLRPPFFSIFSPQHRSAKSAVFFLNDALPPILFSAGCQHGHHRHGERV